MKNRYVTLTMLSFAVNLFSNVLVPLLLAGIYEDPEIKQILMRLIIS